MYHRKFAVDGFELLFQLAIDYLQSSNAESQSCNDSFLREPLTMLRNLAGNNRRGGRAFMILSRKDFVRYNHAVDPTQMSRVRNP